MEHHIAGNQHMKQAAIVALETKNDVLRRDGFSPAQWVLGRAQRRPGSLNEESEWGQLGVLCAQQDSSTAFAQKAAMSRLHLLTIWFQNTSSETSAFVRTALGEFHGARRS